MSERAINAARRYLQESGLIGTGHNIFECEGCKHEINALANLLLSFGAKERETLELIANGEWITDSSAQELAKEVLSEFTAIDRIEVKGDEHERDTTQSGSTTEG